MSRSTRPLYQSSRSTRRLSPRPRPANLYEAKLAKDAAKNINEFASGIKILNGPYGPYITDGKKNARIAKDQDPAKLTEAEAKKILAEAPAKKRGGFRRGKAPKKPNKNNPVRKVGGLIIFLQHRLRTGCHHCATIN